jgi:transposase
MDKQYFFVAIDVSEADLSVAVTGRKATTYRNTKRGIKALYTWAHKLAGELELWFVMEASGVYSLFTAIELVQAHAAVVSHVNPGRIKAHGRAIGIRSKTDAQDALVILDYAQKNELHTWQPAPEAFQKLKYFVDQIQAYNKDIRRTQNRMHAHGFIGAPRMLTTANNAVIRTLNRQVAKLEAAIKELVKADEQLDRQVGLLKTIPGIADVAAWRILAYTRGEITMRTPKQLTAFSGLAPAHRQSGTSLLGKSRIDKQGCAPLRAILYMCSLSAAENNPAVKPLYQRLITRKANPLLKKQARMAVMRKLLLLARAILVSGKPFDPDYHVQLV